ncbi:MAG TPA: tetratricopeptide repeat protein [Candidatus Paceibacterota bacterium]|nr:tetratricopeptide repeat protein [Verrucomicrobiota bacterium]HSA12989.1 tetratricopeptide repeat protein [Candidatus Paceibacterota bacterium]
MRRPATNANPAPMQGKLPVGPAARIPAWLPALLLVLATVLAYLPVRQAGFIWDDDAYVTKNAMLTAPDGLRQIWFSAHRQSQYFPLAYTTLRIERGLWGLNPLGYHAVNVLLHVINALLLWRLLRRLVVPGAWLAAAIFALHPVQVESVAWVTELKNVQSTLFYLLAVLAWVRFGQKPAAPRWSFYWLALLFHALALLSKTTACTLPAALLLVLWWRGESVGWRRVVQVLPFLLLGAGMGVVSVWWENHLGNYLADTGVNLSLVDRLLVATRAVWFYAAKVFWPVNLAFSYPRWEIDARAPLQYLGLAGCVAFALLFWWRRRVVGRGVVAGVVFFVAALSPLLGFIPLYTFRFSFVADHYQYLACAGLIIPAAALITGRLAKERKTRVVWLGLSGGLLLALGLLTWKRAHIYADEKRLWEDTLAKNPTSWMAHCNLAYTSMHAGRADEAIPRFQEALRLKPGDAEIRNNLGNALFINGQTDEAIRQFQETLRLKPDYADAHYNLGNALVKKGETGAAIRQFEEAIRLQPDHAQAHNNLANAFARTDRTGEAIGHYQKALGFKPDYAEACCNLGIILLKEARVDEAIRHLQASIRIKPDYVVARYNLGNALARQGRLDEAVGEFQAVLSLQPHHADARKRLEMAMAALAAIPRQPAAATNR